MKKTKLLFIMLMLLFLQYNIVYASDVNKSMEEAFTQRKISFKSEWQNTTGFYRTSGGIATDIYSQTDLDNLAKIVSGGDSFHGNVFYKKVSSEHCLVQPQSTNPKDSIPIVTFLGKDGILQIANDSKYISDDIVKVAIKYWNELAGATIMEFVTDKSLSDEAIHDLPKKSPNDSTLMAQTYDGQGIVCYPENFFQGKYTDIEFNNAKASVVIHELGHAIGVSHMGGGDDGNNAGHLNSEGQLSYWSEDFMSTWTPYHNPNGVKSTHIDAAALALVGTAWEAPRQVAAWALQFNQASLTLNDNTIIPTTNNIPKGLAFGSADNIIYDDVVLKKVCKNYNVYSAKTVDQSFADKEKYGQVTFIGTTNSLNLNGKSLYLTKDYVAHNAIHIYRVTSLDNNDYIINSDAFNSSKGSFTLPDWGVRVDGEIIKDDAQHYETILKNYSVFEPDINVAELMANGYYHYINHPFSTTLALNLIGKNVLILKKYKINDNTELEKILLSGQVYYILRS